MSWYRENRWLGNFVIAFAASALLALWFLFQAKSGFAEASAQFNDAATERSRLEHLNPFPNEENYRKTQTALDNYGASLNKLKDELRAQTVLPPAGLAPNEFQSRLSRAIVSTTEKARANRVKLPGNFHLGFDEFRTTLPTTAAAPLLGRELAQVELLLGILIDARVDAIAAVKRTAPPAQATAAPTPPPKKPSGPANAAPALVERTIVDLTFTASPSAMRKVLNQIASSDRQFFIVRTLYVRNEQQKGPSRQAASAGSGTAAETAATTAPSAIKFIVGNEHVEATATIEMVRFAF
jgi:hypothetical protein